ncbi:MAG: sigma-70 family RNA polymerase sigma factor [Acidimicrobiales bacterium]|nr:sigma-70 family RNA polymerase sigma factor [Acidimicrobiales bacterium]
MTDPSTRAVASGDVAAAALLDGYERSLPQVYGYLVARCGSVAVAEDLTSETFLGAVAAVRNGTSPVPTTAWLVGIARHKLVDHWRRQEREQRKLAAVADLSEDSDDPWDARLSIGRAREVLADLGPHHRSALVLRYLDGLTVPEVADHLGRTVHATEALLVRARRAFRTLYEQGDDTAENHEPQTPEGRQP